MTWARVNYPGKASLTRSEAMAELQGGPRPDWFGPFADPARVAPQTTCPWGIIHIHSEWGQPPVWELRGFYSAGDLGWALLSLLTRQHDWSVFDVDGFRNDHECHGVWYWLPGDPNELPLRLGVTR